VAADPFGKLRAGYVDAMRYPETMDSPNSPRFRWSGTHPFALAAPPHPKGLGSRGDTPRTPRHGALPPVPPVDELRPPVRPTPVGAGAPAYGVRVEALTHAVGATVGVEALTYVDARVSALTCVDADSVAAAKPASAAA